MKARVIATGEIVDVTRIVDRYVMTHHPHTIAFEKDELNFDIDDDLDYWAHLEHQAAIAAMGGMCGNTKYNDYAWVDMAKFAIKAAHALVEKMKEERK